MDHFFNGFMDELLKVAQMGSGAFAEMDKALAAQRAKPQPRPRPAPMPTPKAPGGAAPMPTPTPTGPKTAPMPGATPAKKPTSTTTFKKTLSGRAGQQGAIDFQKSFRARQRRLRAKYPGKKF